MEWNSKIATALLYCALSGCAADGPDTKDLGTAESTGAAQSASASMGSSGPPAGTGSTDARGDASTGVAGSGSGESASTGFTGPESTGSGTTYAVLGFVTRLDGLSFWPGNDGVGTVYLAALGECTPEAAPVAATTVVDADLSNDGAQAPFRIEGLPDGTFYLAAFMDDDGDADPQRPAPALGDIVLADGPAQGCVEVTVAGGDVEGVVVELNFVLPF